MTQKVSKCWLEEKFLHHSWVMVPASRLTSCQDILGLITQRAGGCTVTGCFGYWHDQTGTAIEEEVYRYEWYSQLDLYFQINIVVGFLLSLGEKSVLTSNGLCYYEDTPN